MAVAAQDDGDGAVTAIDLLLAGFAAAETAAEEAVEAVLQEGGAALYQAYIERKSYPFAAEATSSFVLHELGMCYVQHDEGEDPKDEDGWALEAEPPRSNIDTWGRSCVPIRRKFIKPKNLNNEDTGRGRKHRLTSANNTGSAWSPSKLGVSGVLEFTDVKTAPQKSNFISLVEDREEDEEETLMRDLKDREAKRKREEEARIQRKAADEAEEAARLAQVKDQMKNKPYTYDSNGNVIWIQPLAPERLPNSNPSPQFSFKKILTKEDEEEKDQKNRMKHSRPRRGGSQKRKGKKEPEFADSFKKLTSQQPPLVESMTMMEGVQLLERGRSKRAQEDFAKKQERTMTRADYGDMVSRTSVGGHADGQQRADTSLQELQSREADLMAANFEAMPNTGATIPASAREGGAQSEHDQFNLKIVQATDWGSNPTPPAKPRNVHPVPPSVHSQKMRRDALGYALSTRDRIPTSGSAARFPNFQPQPVIGATMGHGLLPSGPKDDAYFFPGQQPQQGLQERSLSARDIDDERGGPMSARGVGGELPILGKNPGRGDSSFARGGPMSAREGKVVNANPELAKRLFLR